MKCKLCDFETDTRGKLGGHVSKVHKFPFMTSKQKGIFPKVRITKCCITCGKPFLVERSLKNGKDFIPKKEKNTCSSFCAHSRKQTEETKQKISIKSIGNIPSNKGKFKPITKLCIICNEILKNNYVNYHRECYNKISGGAREGSGVGKSGHYKGIFCNSTWELMWVIYSLDHNINFKRFPYQLKNKEIVYLPDFLLIDENKIIEIKGYVDNEEKLKKKIILAKEKGFKIEILYKKDLEYTFEYVKNNYVYKNIEELYDNYKPKFNYTCDICGENFNRNKKIKINFKICSRSCAGKKVSRTR